MQKACMGRIGGRDLFGWSRRESLKLVGRCGGVFFLAPPLVKGTSRQSSSPRAEISSKWSSLLLDMMSVYTMSVYDVLQYLKWYASENTRCGKCI